MSGLSGLTTTAQDVLGAARELADDLLFPDAMRVDGLDVLPVAHLDALAALGLYGAPVPVQAGGLGLDLAAYCAVVEELASGCLTTTFVWLQHRGLVMTLAADGTPAVLRDRWLGPACRGEVRGGIALGGLMPGPPRLRARLDRGGWRLDGDAPWVTGWGLIDLLLVVARGPDDSVVSLIMDATVQPGLTVTRERLAAVNASVTVRLGFDGVLVPEERWVGQGPFDPAESLRPDRMRVNGSLALGLVRRCVRLLGPGPLDDELAACRDLLDDAITADAAAMTEARAAASELAVRAAAALAVRDGSRSVTVEQQVQRLAREALFLLVFGSRPGIKNSLLRRLGATPLAAAANALSPFWGDFGIYKACNCLTRDSQEVHMSVLSRNRVAEAEAAETQQLAWPVVLVRAAVPRVKTAGMAARDGARSAAEWTAPRINQARVRTAPRIERSGLTFRDTVAPKIYETLIAAARYVDVVEPRPEVTAPRRRWPQVVAGTGMLVAAGAAIAVVLRRRKNDLAFEAPEKPAEAVTGLQATQDGQLGADASGAEDNVNKQSR